MYGGEVPMARSRAAETAQQRKWREEEDARTLADANVIHDDPTRMREAARAAERIAKEERKRADAMTRVAGKKDDNSETGKDTKKRVKRRTASPGTKTSNNFNVFGKV